MKIYELPATTQKSYYQKAKVVVTDSGKTLLRSYDTIVAGILSDGSVHRYWNGYSATTAKHVNDFFRLFGKRPVNKREWLNMKVEEVA